MNRAITWSFTGLLLAGCGQSDTATKVAPPGAIQHTAADPVPVLSQAGVSPKSEKELAAIGFCTTTARNQPMKVDRENFIKDCVRALWDPDKQPTHRPQKLVVEKVEVPKPPISTESAEKRRADFPKTKYEVIAKADAMLESNPSKVAELLADFRVLNDPDVESYVRAAEIRVTAHASIFNAQREKRTGVASIMRSDVQSDAQWPAIGMTMAQARDSRWGKPNRVNRTTTALGETELWFYEKRGSLIFSNGLLAVIEQ